MDIHFRSLVILFCLFIPLLAIATIRIVDGNPVDVNASRTVQAAHDLANVGDTIYVCGWSASYGNLVTNKRLVWIGPGYYLSDNSESQALSSAACIGTLTIDTGSENASFSGLSLTGLITINSDSIAIRRCRIAFDAVQHLTANNVNVLFIDQCFFEISWWATVNNIIFNSSHNVFIRNTFFQNSSGNNSSLLHSNGDAGPFTVTNCIFNGGNINLWNTTFTNNILYSNSIAQNNNNYFNNLGYSNHFGTANNNQSYVNMSVVFVGSGTAERRWQLASGSPASQVGFDGTDCGIFGGANPYVLSGIPAIPTITFLGASMNGSTTNGLPVNFRARARN